MSAFVLCLFAGDVADAVPPAHRVKIATVPMDEGAGQLTAYLGGILQGRVNANGTGCFWVGETDQTAILWPNGAYALRRPLRVVSTEGELIAEVGQQYATGGGLLPALTHVLGCPDVPNAFG